ncbi:MAG: hypothetical protein WCC03_09125 [Candidatus Acidiferrales bacterium]
MPCPNAQKAQPILSKITSLTIAPVIRNEARSVRPERYLGAKDLTSNSATRVFYSPTLPHML